MPWPLVVSLLGAATATIPYVCPREPASWQGADRSPIDFYDLKGVLEAAFENLRIGEARYEPAEIPIFHPGKCARILHGERQAGIMGELHPLVSERYDFSGAPVLVAELDMQVLMDVIPEGYPVEPVPPYPPVLEDLAVIVAENVPAETVAAVIRQAGGNILSELRLFDVYRGAQIGTGKKSLAYSLVYQSYDRTLTDEEVLKIRNRIVRRLDEALGAYLRS